MQDRAHQPLDGSTVVSFESRRAAEMAELIRRYGGRAIVAPSMREIPLAHNEEALQFLSELRRQRIDVTVLLTGVGTRTLAAALAASCSPGELSHLLARTTVVARGPKPVAALRELGLRPHVTVPEPNTWREILETLDREVPLAGKHVAVQEYGRSNPELLEGLRTRGADVLRVPVYRWALPEDVGPLRAAIHRICAGDVDFTLFTSANQVDNVLLVANEEDCRAAFLNGTRGLIVASIGPVCSDALRAQGLAVDLEPEHPKMGPLVQAVARQGPELLLRKRAAATA